MRALLCIAVACLGAVAVAAFFQRPVAGMEVVAIQSPSVGAPTVSADLAMNDAPAVSPSIHPHWRSVRTFPLVKPLDRPIRVYIEPGSRLTTFRPQYNRAVINSFDQWAEALDGRLQVVYVNSPRHADIQIQWLSTFREPDVGGDTFINVGSSVIRIRTAGMSPGDVETNILHEIGHALGIQGHSPYSGDVMVGRRRWVRSEHYRPTLSSRDKQAIRRLYGSQWIPGEDLYQPGQVAQN